MVLSSTIKSEILPLSSSELPVGVSILTVDCAAFMIEVNLLEKLYQQANPQGAQGGAQGGYQPQGDDGVVDADYETVD